MARKTKRKFWKDRGKRINKWILKSYPLSSVTSLSNKYKPMRYHLTGEDNNYRVSINLLQNRNNFALSINIQEKVRPNVWSGINRRSFLMKKYDLDKEDAFNEIKKDIRRIENYVYRSESRKRKLSSILYL